jgi:hypothetical protein
MNMEIGTEAAQFPEKENINGTFVAVLKFTEPHFTIYFICVWPGG